MAAVSVAERPLDAIYAEATPYPAHLLREGDTGLCLFAAAFLGTNDAVHMARSGMRVTCVDTDGPRLAEMEGLYPKDWAFHVEDAWDWALDAYSRGDRWDVVSVDTFTGNATDQSCKTIGLWLSLANRAVTMTIPHRAELVKSEAEATTEWKASRYERSWRADWLVLTRA